MMYLWKNVTFLFASQFNCLIFPVDPLETFGFFGSWLRSFVTLAGFRSRPCISWWFSSLLFTCILLVRIHKLYQFVFLLRELYWRQGAPAANNLPDNFWKKLFRSHLWLRFGWLCVGSWKRSGKDCIFSNWPTGPPLCTIGNCLNIWKARLRTI